MGNGEGPLYLDLRISETLGVGPVLEMGRSYHDRDSLPYDPRLVGPLGEPPYFVSVSNPNVLYTVAYEPGSSDMIREMQTFCGDSIALCADGSVMAISHVDRGGGLVDLTHIRDSKSEGGGRATGIFLKEGQKPVALLEAGTSEAGSRPMIVIAEDNLGVIRTRHSLYDGLEYPYRAVELPEPWQNGFNLSAIATEKKGGTLLAMGLRQPNNYSNNPELPSVLAIYNLETKSFIVREEFEPLSIAAGSDGMFFAIDRGGRLAVVNTRLDPATVYIKQLSLPVEEGTRGRYLIAANADNRVVVGFPDGTLHVMSQSKMEAGQRSSEYVVTQTIPPSRDQILASYTEASPEDILLAELIENNGSFHAVYRLLHVNGPKYFLVPLLQRFPSVGGNA